MKFKLFLAAALSGAFLGQAHADDCNTLLDRVDELLAAQSGDLNEEVLGQIMALRNQGAEDCNAGDDEQASESLEHAISLFTQ